VADRDSTESSLWAVDSVVKPVALSAVRGCAYTAANTGSTYTATRTGLLEDFELTVTANTTITLAGGSVSGEVSVWNITFVQDSTGGRTVTVNSVAWSGGTPDFTTDAGAANHCSFVQHGTGTIYGFYGGSSDAVVLPPVAGYYDWWDATDVATMTLTGSRVDTWTSKGSQATVITRTAGNPTIGTDSINGLQTIDFDGSTYFSGSTYHAQPITYFVLFIRHSDSTAHLIDGADGSARNLIGFGGSAYYQMYAGTVGTGGTPDASPHIRTSIFNGASSADYIDGVSIFSGAAGSQSQGAFYVGAGTGPALGFNGLIGEILVYASALGTTDREAVEDYFTTKWLS
jgi:hypothetical protein